MATWKDGPEYAPAQRPDEFAAPAVAVALLPAPPEPNLAEGAPESLPDTWQIPQTAELSALAPRPDGDQRDARIPFEVTTAALTAETSAWSATHQAPVNARSEQEARERASTPAFDPRQPMTSMSTTPPPWAPPTAPMPGQPDALPLGSSAPAAMATGTPGWFAPTSMGSTGTASGPVTAGAIVRAFSPAVVALLVLGIVAPVLGPLALLGPLAFIAASIVARLKVTRARSTVLSLFTLGDVLLVLLGAATLAIDGSDLVLWAGSLAGMTSLSSVLILAVGSLTIASALRSPTA